LFAGYAYLKDLPPERGIDYHNKESFQNRSATCRPLRRCARMCTHVCFLEPDVVDLALQIPIDLKLREGVEK